MDWLNYHDWQPAAAQAHGAVEFWILTLFAMQIFGLFVLIHMPFRRRKR